MYRKANLIIAIMAGVLVGLAGHWAIGGAVALALWSIIHSIYDNKAV